MQVSPQPAQALTVPVEVSQPGAEVQSANPALQLTSVQPPEEQEVVAFGRVQSTPQAPQLVGELRLLSQPLSGLLSQSSKPGSHTGAQSKLPALRSQLLLPCALLQVLPQEAQLLVVPSWVSQPAVALQSAKPSAQLICTQVPLLQEASPFGTVQATPQVPQFSSVRTLVSQPLSGIPSQSLNPAAQTGRQPLLVQVVVPC